MKYHFSGYATKFNIPCTDGRTIKDSAFKHNDGAMVPLAWSHGHDSPDNIIGHALLEYREGDGMYAYGTFNDTEKGKTAKLLVEHEDITALSIYANQLKQAVNDVIHGCIREVSLVLAGANPEAMIDFVSLAHGDGFKLSETDALIYITDQDAELKHVGGDIEVRHADNGTGEKTLAEIVDTFSEEQKTAMYAIIGMVAEGAMDEDSVSQSDQDDDTLEHTNDGGNKDMKKNVFTSGVQDNKSVLSHADIQSIFKHAEKTKGNLSESILAHLDEKGNEKKKDAYLTHAATYGIENIDVLFPEAKNVMNTPEFDMRRVEWVKDVLAGVHKVPFSRIRSMYADITADEARAKGYIKGNEKIEEVFPIFKRTTEPTTIYKKQKLDRDDIIDITDINVVMWLKSEMRLMLDEERARAYLIGDGRSGDNPDKIDELKIRPIYKDSDKYSIKVQLTAAATGLDELEALKKARKDYKGTGNPSLYTTAGKIIDWTLLKDENGNYRFRDAPEVAKFLNVKKIVEVDPMNGVSRDVEGVEHDLLGIVVNLMDYTSGADKGGNIALFDDFDIDFNQYKYLMETRCSGALTKLYSALVIEKAQVVE